MLFINCNLHNFKISPWSVSSPNIFFSSLVGVLTNIFFSSKSPPWSVSSLNIFFPPLVFVLSEHFLYVLPGRCPHRTFSLFPPWSVSSPANFFSPLLGVLTERFLYFLPGRCPHRTFSFPPWPVSSPKIFFISPPLRTPTWEANQQGKKFTGNLLEWSLRKPVREEIYWSGR